MRALADICLLLLQPLSFSSVMLRSQFKQVIAPHRKHSRPMIEPQADAL